MADTSDTDKTAKGGAADPFRSGINLKDFALGLAQVPQLGDLLRYAGLQDARTMASVRITSARMDAIRAKAIGDPRATDRAARAEAHATHLARAARREETRALPEASVLGPLIDMVGRFRLVGKVLDKAGEPVPGATVEIAGAKSGAIFTARTDGNGVYDLSVKVGADKDKADEGEALRARVLQAGTVLQEGVAGLVRAGTMARRILTVDSEGKPTDPAAPIATERPVKAPRRAPRRSPKARKPA